MNDKEKLPPEKSVALLKLLKDRFDKNMNRHKGLNWSEMKEKLENNREKLWLMNKMEQTGGEPDVIDYDNKTGGYIFIDCSE